MQSSPSLVRSASLFKQAGLTGTKKEEMGEPSCLHSSESSPVPVAHAKAHPLAGHSFVTTGQAALYSGLCRNSIKALLASGELTGRLTKGGHWRVGVASLLSYVDGVEQEELVEEVTPHKGVACYIRVSSEKQAEAGSLERQEARLRAEVSSRENIPAKSLPIYSDIASSFGSRKGLNALVGGQGEAYLPD